MATLADELLNDFEDTGSETEEQAAEENGTVNDISTAGASATNGATQNELGMELDDDEEDVGDADESHGLSATKAAQEAEDEEETKARIEKLQLRRVADVRSVAGLMKALAPVLEVSFSLFSSSLVPYFRLVFSSIYVRGLQRDKDERGVVLTCAVAMNRKSSIFRAYHRRNSRKMKARSRITPSTVF